MAMCYTIHQMLFEEIRPFDWIMLVVEVLVLILIAVEIFVFTGPEWWHGIQAKKKASKLFPFLAQGEALRNLISENPNQDHNQQRENILKWDRETQEFLTKLSSRALSTFRHVAHVSETDRGILTPSGQFYPASGLFGDAYQMLQARLDNLQKIIEKPEVYF